MCACITLVYRQRSLENIHDDVDNQRFCANYTNLTRQQNKIRVKRIKNDEGFAAEGTL